MGLDHGLTRKHYVQNWDSTKPEERYTITVKKGGKNLPAHELNVTKISYITEDIVTWRKANAIHLWFVTNVQKGEDDCREYYVAHNQLKELLDTMKQVVAASELVPGQIHAGTRYHEGKTEEIYENGQIIKDPTVAKQLLPSGSGFFFGHTDYDEWYLAPLLEAIPIFEEVLKDPSADLEYWSSW